jgi:YHS domain-containing protein
LTVPTAIHKRQNEHFNIEVKKSKMPKDPVCGAIMDDKTAKFKITHDGETYHFCSLACKKRFKRHPAKFIK